MSGAHLNPAVTAAFLLTGKVSILRALFYILVQILGCLSGSAMLKVSFTPKILAIFLINVNYTGEEPESSYK